MKLLSANDLIQGRYRIMEVLATGGASVVYRAWDETAPRLVAVKQCRLADAHLADRRFAREAALLRQLRHPALPEYVDYFTTDEGGFLVMEFVPGDDLGRELGRRGAPFDLHEVADWAEQLLDVLSYLHRHDPAIIHRDIKPANLKQTADGRIKLLDFGLAKHAGASTTVHGYSTSYSSPEQMLGEGTDVRSDLYSLAATLYDLLTGVRPADALERRSAALIGKPDLLRPACQLNPAVSPMLSEWLNRALALVPAGRFASADEMRQALRMTLDLDRGETRIIVAPVSRMPAAPSPLTGLLLGRDADLAHVRASLRRESIRLITLTGLGGVGKTRLAQEVMASLTFDFPDGAWFIPLASLAQPEQVADAIAQRLGVSESAEQPARERVAEFLRDRRTLLVLDNFEHVTPAAPDVAMLLQRCPRLKILVTSRTRLRLAGEHEFVVKPLSAPDLDQPLSVETLMRLPSVQLFVSRCQATLPAFQLTEQNALAVQRLCAHLDGLPLAIELAAARIRVLSPQAMLERLRDRFVWLRRGSDRSAIDGLNDQHSSLDAVMEWSYSLLDEMDRGVLCAVAVFEAGCVLDSLCRVVGLPDDAQSEARLMTALESLLDNHLIESSNADESRFTMLEVVREFALRKLRARADEAAIHHRHADEFVALAESAEPHLRGPRQADHMARLAAEQANLRQALAWLLYTHDASRALRLVAALWRFWWVRAHLREGLHWVGAALALPYDAGNDAGAEGAGSFGLLRLRALLGGAAIARDLAQFDLARGWFDEALALSQALNDPASEARALTGLGSLHLYAEEYEAALSLFERSLALSRRLNDRLGIAGALNNLGMTHMHLGRYGSAMAAYRDSLPLYRDLGDEWGTALALNNLAFAAFKQGDLDHARAWFRDSLRMFHALDDAEGMTTVLEAMAWLNARAGELDRAAQLAGATEAHRQRLGTRLYGLDQAEHEIMLAHLEAHLPPARLFTAWQAGRSMSLPDAMALALPVEAIP